MPRALRRATFTLASAISLGVCIVVLLLWARSAEELDRIRSGTAVRRTTIHSKDGEIYFDVATASRPVWRPGFQHIHALPTQFRPPTPSWEIAGLGSGSETVNEGDVVIHRRFAEIPLWPIAVSLCILPVIWWDARAKRNRPQTVGDMPTQTFGAASVPADPQA